MKDYLTGDNVKTIVTGALVIAAVVIGYYILYATPASENETLAYDKGELSDSSAFALALQSADKVYVVMDLRNASEKQRNNIMQCGTDFAGSSGLVGKEIIAFALENGKCTSLDGTTTINNCIKEAEGGIGIYIRGGKYLAFFKNKMVTEIGENYTLKSCSISIKERNESAE